MHIIFVSTEVATKENSTGGLGTFTMNLARIFSENNHDVKILCVTTKEQNIKINDKVIIENIYIDKDDWDEYDYIAKLCANEVKGDKEEIRKTWIRIRKMELVRDKIFEIHKREKVDIVHFCNHGAFSLLMGRKIPYIIRISGHVNILEGGANTPKGSIRYEDNPLNLKEELELYALKKSNYIVAPSRLVADIGRNSLGLYEEVIESPYIILKNEWDENIYKSYLENKKYILYFGALKYLKGIQVIADLIEKFLEVHTDMYFVLSGNDNMIEVEGTEILASQYIKKRAGSYSDRVFYLGKLVRESLYPIIQNSEMCLLPSRIENLSNACIEAMALGKIVIATNGASYEQLIDNGVNGFLCERDNAEDFLKNIEKILNLEEEEKEKICFSAKERIKDLAPEKIYEQYLNYYKMVIKQWESTEKRKK